MYGALSVSFQDFHANCVALPLVLLKNDILYELR